MRITHTTPDLPAVQRGKPIELTINGRKVTAYDGELVSSVLNCEGISVYSRKHNTGRPSGIFCGMGVCYECLVTIDGIANIRACQTYAVDHMVILTADEDRS